MNSLVPAALFGWPILAVLLFVILPQRTAVLVAFIGAWLFLPVASYEIAGLPDYTRASAASYGVLAGLLLTDWRRILAFRPAWVDFPVVLYCGWAATSSLVGGRGVWDAYSAVYEHTVVWGLPYLFGRTCFSDLKSLRMLATGIVVGGLVYVPLCLIEVRLSPQLHIWIYGFHQHMFGQSVRFGGYRPTVFMEHGLAVAMWMISATLLAFTLWLTNSRRHLLGLHMKLIASVLLGTSVLCKSTGALTLLLLSGAALWCSRSTSRTWPLLLLIAVPPVWMTGRTFDLFNGRFISDSFEILSAERAESFAIRLQQEDEILQIAMRHPLVGGTRWFQKGADQLWLISFRNFGAVGLAAVTGIFLLPCFILLRRYSWARLTQPELAPVLGLSMVLTLSMIDHLMNAMVNPVFTIAAGALGTLVGSQHPSTADSQLSLQPDQLQQHRSVTRQLWPGRQISEPQ